ASDIALEASAVAVAVRQFTEEKASWTGTATDLLAELTKMVGEEKAKTTLPPKANALSGKLKRATPALRKCGINVTIERHNRGRIITLEAGPESKGKTTSPSSPSSRQGTGDNHNCKSDSNLWPDDRGEVPAEGDRHGSSPDRHGLSPHQTAGSCNKPGGEGTL